jgi:endonuclease/exonuclease/phosphatase family metal-dependent hydrolase
MLAVLIFVVLALAAAVIWMADGIQTPETIDGRVRTIDGVEAKTSTPAELRVLSWNIAWGYGWGSEGSGSAKEKDHFDRSLDAMGATIRDLGADVVLLQEIDFDCTRSHGVDQAELLARKAGLPYVAYAVSWRANWLPFPYWPPADHYGRMSSGGAILSRFPITSNRVELFPKPEENSFVYNLFYLFRYGQTVEIDRGGSKLVVINTHLEAFRRGTREAQAAHLASAVASVEEERLIFGGDLNSVPEEAALRRGYPDEPETTHDGERTVALFRAVEGLADTVPSATAGREHFTFPSHAPNRKLDYLFHGSGYELLEVRALTEAGTASDHLPMFARLRER